MHPENTISKPGRMVEFAFKTSPEARTHEWHFNDRPILISNNSYEGSATSNLLVKKALSKHKGDYKCIATDDFGRSYTSKNASLIIGKLGIISKHKFRELSMTCFRHLHHAMHVDYHNIILTLPLYYIDH